jgi:putative membrane protein
VPKYWTVLFLAAWLWSAVAPYGFLTWLLEMLPAAGCFLVLASTQRWFVFTPMAYALLLVLCLLILAGAHYSFARVPAFEWLKPWLGTERNDFDKLAHFFQGLVPAIVFREFLIRLDVVPKRVWLWGIVPALALALSAAYELVEWAAALVLAEEAEDFLAVQGDTWDAQSDMAMALLGALAALVLLHRFHDRQIARLEGETGRESPIRGLPNPRRPMAP